MRLYKPTNLLIFDHLVINDQPINKVDDFKYLRSYFGFTENNVQIRIDLAWAAFAKLKSIRRSLKPKLNLEFFKKGMRLDIVEKLRDMDTYGGIYPET